MSPLPPKPFAVDADRQVAALRAEFEALQRAFARYLDGLERVPPLAARDAFVVALRQAQVEGRGSHAARLQLQNLRASWAVYAPRYERALARMEAGNYVPQHRRALHVPAAGTSPGAGARPPATQTDPTAAASEAPAPPERAGLSTTKRAGAAGGAGPSSAQVSPPTATGRGPVEPRAATGAEGAAHGAATGTGGDDALGRLHATWAAAAVSSGARVPSREALAAVVAHKVAEVRARTGYRQVEVRVVVEHGAPVLQVVPKSG